MLRPFAICFLLVPTLGSAATFNVTRLDDPAPDTCLPADCSLREAVLAANALAGADVVTLGDGDFVLGAALQIGDTLEIAGTSSNDTRIATPASALAFDLARGTTLTVRGIGIHGGGGVRGGAFGSGDPAATQLNLFDVSVNSLGSSQAAVDTVGKLLARDIYLTRSPSEGIWGLRFNGSRIDLSDAQLVDNAEGINITLSGPDAHARIARTRIDGGGAENSCAALAIHGAGRVLIDRVEERGFFSFSHATVCLLGSLVVEIRDSTFSENWAAGVLLGDGVSAQLRNSTFVGGGDAIRFPALVLGQQSSATLTHVTLRGTGAPAVVTAQNAGVTFANTLIDGVCEGEGTFLRAGANLGLIDQACALSAAAGDIIVGNALLGGLANNGGSTRTLLPQAGSAAIDAVPVDSALCPPTDQRGFVRIAPCDIGAVETDGLDDLLLRDSFEF